MAATTTSSSSSSSKTQQQVSLRSIRKPTWKNPSYVRPSSNSKTRAWKNLKQILILEASNAATASKPDAVTYKSIEAPPTLLPKKKYCDITGFMAPYRDPKTNLQYCNARIYRLIATMPNDIVQRYLALRKAEIVLK